MKPLKHYRLGTWLQVVGGIAVLLSFIVQQAAYEHWSDQEKNHQAAQSAYFLTHITSLSYQNLFYSSGALTKIQNGELLRKAAEQDAHGRIFMTLAENGDKASTATFIVEAQRRVQLVDSFDSYGKFIDWLNSANVHSPTQTVEFLSQSRGNLALWKGLMNGLFILGTVAALFGTYFEKKASARDA